jgi:helix-turn-helix protein
MIEKSPLCPERVRRITGSFAFLEHRFVRDGFWTSLTHHELLLYIFLVLVADRNGLSYYSFDKICALLQLSLDDYLLARNALIKKDLIAFDGHLFQVLALPPRPVLQPPTPLHSAQHMAQADPATIRQLIRNSLGADHD